MTELEQVTQYMSERQRWYLEELLGYPQLEIERTYYNFYCQQLWVIRETGKENPDLSRALDRLERVMSPFHARFLRAVAKERREDNGTPSG